MEDGRRDPPIFFVPIFFVMEKLQFKLLYNSIHLPSSPALAFP